MCKIDENRCDIKEYLEETDSNGRKVNTNYTEREKDFVRNIEEIESIKAILKEELKEEKGFFSILKILDQLLLAKNSFGKDEVGEYGYFSKEEVEEILKYIFIQRYVVAHAEDNTDEKPMNTALQDFISDKYDSGVHFFEEILQNIDDAIGCTENLKDENNNVEIKWEGKQIVFTYPDRGFSFYDLMAITSLGNSIKKGNLEYASIGEKGIGFKSVFNVAKKVDIKSKFYSFGILYDKSRKTSVLQPNYIVLNGTRSNRTELKITFFDEFAIDDIEQKEGFKSQLWKWLFENEKGDYLNYSPFIFLKNVKKVIYSDDTNVSEIVVERENIKNIGLNLIKINGVEFLQYKSNLKFSWQLIANRWGKEYVEDKPEDFEINRPIEIAFPIVDDGNETNAKIKNGLFYSYLPTEMVIDNPIYINVDVHLKSSRGRISESDFKEGSEWNKHVKDNLNSALNSAFDAIIQYKDNDTVWKVAKKLYCYMSKIQNTQHYFYQNLKEFNNNIKNKAVYLNCKKDFVEKKFIWNPNVPKEEDWDNFVRFCINQPFPDNEIIKDKQYAFDFGWFELAKSKYLYDDSWMGELLAIYKGIDVFYNHISCEYDDDKKNEIFLWILKGAMNSQKEKDGWKILFVEDKDNKQKFSICNKEEIESKGHAIFFRNSLEDVDDELSEYIYENIFENEDHKNNYKECLKNFVSKKDWCTFLENKLKELVNEENISLEKCFDNTYQYVSKISDTSNIKIPDEIKKNAVKVVLPSMFIPNENVGNNIYLKRIAEYMEEYKSKEKDTFGYRLFNGDIDGKDIEKAYLYLCCLGCKNKPDIIKEDGVLTFDELTREIMPDYTNTSTDQNTLLFTYDGNEEEKKLKEYLVDFVEKYSPKNNFDVSVLMNFPFDKIIFINSTILVDGFNILIHPTGPSGGITGDFRYEYFHKINSFTKNANDNYILFNGKKEKININSGRVLFADINQFKTIKSDKIKRFFEGTSTIDYYGEYDKGKRYNDLQNGVIERIISNSAPDDMLEKIRWISIWNKVFGVKYYWPETLNMTIDAFLSCYEYIGREDIDALFAKGYQVTWPNNDGYIGCVSEEIKEYLCEECGIGKTEDIDEKNYCVIEVDENIEKDFLVLSDYKNLRNKEKYSYLIFVSSDSKKKKTEYVTKIVKVLGVTLSEVQKMELCDILGEVIEEKGKKIVELWNSINTFTECIFNDGELPYSYSDIIKNTKKQLPSVWTKTKSNIQKKEDWVIKNWLCEPYYAENLVFQGYGYQCPICGSSSKIHSLTGLKYIRRVKNSDVHSNTKIPYLYLIACLNCADMIEGAKKISIKDYDGSNLVDVIEHFEKVCYCSDQYHMYNNSKMKTMKLIMEIDGKEFCEDIKVSFLHLALIAKLRKNKS